MPIGARDDDVAPLFLSYGVQPGRGVIGRRLREGFRGDAMPFEPADDIFKTCSGRGQLLLSDDLDDGHMSAQLGRSLRATWRSAR